MCCVFVNVSVNKCLRFKKINKEIDARVREHLTGTPKRILPNPQDTGSAGKQSPRAGGRCRSCSSGSRRNGPARTCGRSHAPLFSMREQAAFPVMFAKGF